MWPTAATASNTLRTLSEHPRVARSKPNLSSGWLSQVTAFFSRHGLRGQCRGTIQSRLKKILFLVGFVANTAAGLPKELVPKDNSKVTCESPGLQWIISGAHQTLTKAVWAWVEKEELQPSSCPGSNTAFSHGTQVTPCAAAIVTISYKKLKISAVLQVNLQKAVKIHASAVNMSQTSHLDELVSTSHTLASELSCSLIMYPWENSKGHLKKKRFKTENQLDLCYSEVQI